MGAPRTHHGSTMEAPWEQDGGTTDPRRNHHEDTLMTSRKNHGGTMKTPGRCHGRNTPAPWKHHEDTQLGYHGINTEEP